MDAVEIPGVEDVRETAYCCALGCDALADVEITHQCGDAYDVTYACSKHINDLLGHSGAGGDPDINAWTVSTIHGG